MHLYFFESIREDAFLFHFFQRRVDVNLASLTVCIQLRQSKSKRVTDKVTSFS
jgi:hypothetical protein